MEAENVPALIEQAAGTVGHIGTQLDLISGILMNSGNGMEASESEVFGELLQLTAEKVHNLYSGLYEIMDDVKGEIVIPA